MRGWIKAKPLFSKLTLISALTFNVSVAPYLAAVSLPTVATVAVVMTLPVVETGCSKDQLLAAAKDVISVVNDPAIIEAAGRLSPDAVAKLASISAKAKQLYDAIKASDKTTAAGLVADIFPVIESFAKDFGADTRILAILALANIALKFLLNHLTPAAAAALGGPLNGMRQSKAWGCDYRPKDKRCAKL